MLVGALRAADRRPTQFCAPSIFLRPCFRRPKANRRFTAQKQASPTELPRQVFCKPEQHSPLLPFCLPAVQKSFSLLFIIKFYPHASCLRLSHPLFGTRSNRRHAAFSESRSDKVPRRAELFFIIYIVLFRIYLSTVVTSAFRNPLKSQACRFFGIPFGQSFPLRRFTHCGTADRRATNVPRRILQTMFRSVTIFMRSTVSGNSLLPNRFSDRAHNFSNAHRERITAAASFFFF